MKSTHPFKFLNGNKKCDDDTDDADDDKDDASDDDARQQRCGRHDPYVSAMLHRQHKNSLSLNPEGPFKAYL